MNAISYYQTCSGSAQPRQCPHSACPIGVSIMMSGEVIAEAALAMVESARAMTSPMQSCFMEFPREQKLFGL